MEYGQFCPVAKSMELPGEKWTLLILRELHMGATRFNELQHGPLPDFPNGADQAPDAGRAIGADAQYPALDFRQYFRRHSPGARNLAKVS